MMRDDDTLGLLALGGGAAALTALRWRRARDTSLPAASVLVTKAAWVHPVPNLGDRVAVVSNPFRAALSPDGKSRQHLGVDLMFRRSDARDLIGVYPPGSPNGSRLFFMPDDVPVFAASAGVVRFAANTPVGRTVIVRHPNGWATYYTHLASLAVKVGQTVIAGEVLGTIGASPEDAAHLKHLHLEVWKGGSRAGAVDPDPFLRAWSRTTIHDWSPRTSVAMATTPRNGTMTAYRPVGDRGEPYPQWVRNLRDESGVYVIREIGGPIVYVGSSVGRLYDTLTRHFQTVRHEAQEVPMT